MKSFFNYTRSEIADLTGRTARATRLYQAVYKQGIRQFDGAITLTDSDRCVAAETFSLELPAIVRRFQSADGTRRYLARLEDGEMVESVTIPEDDRSTFCVSSQVGCALACKFCLTGQLGFTRNLTAGEIVSQVILQRHDLASSNTDRLSVVLMGMGEPLLNYENVLRAIQILHDDYGLNLSLHRMTLSTAGLLPEIKRLANGTLFPNLSISLTGATDVQMKLDVSTDVADGRFPPGVLLPLLDDALRARTGACDLIATRSSGDCKLVLTLPARPLDATVARVRLLLADLYGTSAEIVVAHVNGVANATVKVPYERA